MSTAADVQVTGFDLHEMARQVSKMQAGNGATLVLSYPNVDARNHKSLDALTAVLSGHGMPRVAALLHDEKPFVMIDNALAALKVYREIQMDSFAIGVSLFFNGKGGSEAEAEIQALAPHRRDTLAAQHTH